MATEIPVVVRRYQIERTRPSTTSQLKEHAVLELSSTLRVNDRGCDVREVLLSVELGGNARDVVAEWTILATDSSPPFISYKARGKDADESDFAVYLIVLKTMVSLHMRESLLTRETYVFYVGVEDWV